MSGKNICISVVAIDSYKFINYFVIIKLFSYPYQHYPTWESTSVQFYAFI